MNDTKSVSQLINQCPPWLVVGLARRRHSPRKGMSTADISREAGIPQRTLVRILAKSHWGSVKLDYIHRIFHACSIDVFRMSRIREYVRDTNYARHPFRHLSEQQRRTLLIRMKRFIDEQSAAKAT